MSRLIRAFLAVFFLLAPAHAEELLPRPAGLEAPVRFWTRVYSEVDGNGGLIHDSRHLEVVYEVLRFPSGMSDRSRERRVERVKGRYRDILSRLARGKRSGLSAEEKVVLALWPNGVSNKTLKDASRRLRFQRGQADKFRAGLARAGAWRSHILKTLDEHGVPSELVALPHVESSFNPAAYSRVGAAGLWQFTRGTGKRYLRIDSVVDERLDPHKASVAAARLLRENHGITHTWPLAITSYNHGAAGMRRATRKLGTTDISRIVFEYKSRTFGFASRNFYASFLAASAIDQDPDRFFGRIVPDAPIDYTIVELPHYYPMASLARALDVPTETLRAHNGALRPAVWNGSKHAPRGYGLRVPREMIEQPPSELLAKIPTKDRLSAQHRDRYYKVRRGDTLSRIASRYRVSERQLMSLNNLRSRHRIRAGQVLVLPDGAAGGRSRVAREERPADGTYRVRRGDSISRIAQRFGVTEADLIAANSLRNPHRIAVGHKLTIPGAASQPAVPPKVVASSSPSPTPERPEPKPAAPAPKKPTVVASAEPPAPAAQPAPVAKPEPAPEPVVEPAPQLDPEPQPAIAETAPLPEPAPLENDGRGVPDPSDYSVHTGKKVTVQADETLGHYAEWLEIRASELRRINRMRYGQDLVIGRRVRLDFARVAPEEFERRRLDYHRSIQQEFFDAYVVTGTEEHVLRQGDTLWYLARNKYQVPVWLLRQYNPELDFATLSPGAKMIVPRVSPRTS
jgi:membrane-bound lytic murein transglycosylase D